MFTRKEVKDKAKDFLSGNYLSILVISLVVSISTGFNTSNINNSEGSYFPYLSLVLLVISLFIYPALTVGGIRALQKGKAKGGKVHIKDMFSIFNSDEYWNITKIIIMKDIYLFFWTLLFIVPGVIKSYEYIFIPHVLAEDGSANKEDVFALSKQMTSGEKFNIFIFNLSFIGWYLLGFLALLIGIIFVIPYPYVAEEELYQVIKSKM